MLAAPVLPEFAENTPEHLAVAAGIVASPEVEAIERPRLQAIVANAVAGEAFQSKRTQIERVGQILEWRYFGKPGDDLPDGLAVTNWSGSIPFLDVQLDTAKQLSSIQFGVVRQQLEQRGLRDIEQVVTADIGPRQPETEQRLKNLVVNTPTYQLLRSFSIQAPSEAVEMPLREEIKTSRKAALRKQFDADNLEQVRPRTPIEAARQFAGQFALNRASNALEIAVEMELQTAPMPSAVQRARAYFVRQITDTLLPRISYSPETERQQYINGLMAADSKIKTQLGMADLEVDHYSNFVDDLQTLSPLDRLLSSALLQEVLPLLYDSNSTAATYDQSIDSAVTAIAQKYATELTTLDFTQFERPHSLFPYFLAPKAVLVDRITASAEPLPLPPSERCYNRSLEQLKQAESTSVGEVVYGNPGTTRLIGFQDRQPRDEHPYDLDLIVRLDDAQALFQSFDPEIPGYELVSREGQQFGFKKMDIDPYEEDGAILPGDFDALSQELEKRGLFIPELREPNLTATRLAEILSQYTEQLMPSQKISLPFSHKDIMAKKLPSVYNISDFSDLKRFVSKKKFWAQCTGSHDFAQLVFGELLPEGTQAIGAANGLIISPYSTRITATSHRQTVINLNGKTRIVDAASKQNLYVMEVTGGRHLFGAKLILNREIMIADPNNESSIPQQRQKPEAEQIETPQAPEPQPEEISIPERITGIHNGLVNQLIQVLGTVNSEQLYKTVVKLPIGVDPIRRTVEFSLRARSGNATQADVTEIQRYLELYKTKSPQERDRVGVESYGDSLIDMLSVTIGKLASYVPAERPQV